MNDMPEDNLTTEPVKRSKRGFLGCLLVLALLLIVGMVVANYFAKDLAKEMGAIEAKLEMSPALEEQIGSPIKIQPNFVPKTESVDGATYSTISGIVSGPKGEGAYKARLLAEGTDFTLKSLTVDVNGEQLDLTGDAEANDEEMDLGIDLGE